MEGAMMCLSSPVQPWPPGPPPWSSSPSWLVLPTTSCAVTIAVNHLETVSSCFSTSITALCVKGSHPSKKTVFFMKYILWVSCTNIEFWLALVMIYAVLSNFDFVAKFTVKNLNKDFINAVRGGGVTVLWKYFIKKRYFLKDGFP